MAAEHRQRRLDENRREGADHDDHNEARQQGVNARALEHRAHEHRANREHKSDGRKNIHDVSCLPPRSQ
jgi:hypothetical protein